MALYGLGNIRDERLNRMFQVLSLELFLLFNFWFKLLTYVFGLSLISQTPHAVQWMRPEAQEGCLVSDWFNMLVLHQNRLCVSETVLVWTSVWKCLYVFLPVFLEDEMSRFVFEILPNLDILTFSLSFGIIKIISCIASFFILNLLLWSAEWKQTQKML